MNRNQRLKKKKAKNVQRKINKHATTGALDELYNNAMFQRQDKKGRGIMVFSVGELLGATARTKDGILDRKKYQLPFHMVSPERRMEIIKKCPPVFAIINNTAKKSSTTKFTVTSDKKVEDRLVSGFRDAYNIINEFSTSDDMTYKITSHLMKRDIFQKLRSHGLRPDLKNFDSTLIRWRRGLRYSISDRCDEIEDWLNKPNPQQSWTTFLEQWIVDYMTHGDASVYKHADEESKLLKHMRVLPGGTTFPVKSHYFSTDNFYIQYVPGYEKQLFGADEISQKQFLSASHQDYGLVPLEVLLTKILEYTNFDTFMEEQADGSKPPEKMVIIAEHDDFNTFGGEDFGAMAAKLGGMTQEQQGALEDKLREPVKGGIVTFKGNHVEVVDLSRADTIGSQSARQVEIEKMIALVFGGTALEMNQTGSDSTSGRATSETEAEIDYTRGVYPILAKVEEVINNDILPYRYGTEYSFSYGERAEQDKNKLAAEIFQGGVHSCNEVRTEILNKMPFEGEEYNRPPGSQVQGAMETLGGFFGGGDE